MLRKVNRMLFRKEGQIERIVPGTPPFERQVAGHISRYKFVAGYVEGKRILDISCGTGYGSELLSQEAKEVIGGDLSEEAVNYARLHYQKSNLQFQVMDITKVRMADETVDIVVSLETFEHLKRPEKAARECHRILKKKGLLILSVPNGEIDRKEGNKFHLQFFTLLQLRNLLEPYFRIIRTLGQRKVGKTRFVRKTLAEFQSPRIIKILFPQWFKKIIHNFRYASYPSQKSNFVIDDSNLFASLHWILVCQKITE